MQSGFELISGHRKFGCLGHFTGATGPVRTSSSETSSVTEVSSRPNFASSTESDDDDDAALSTGIASDRDELGPQPAPVERSHPSPYPFWFFTSWPIWLTLVPSLTSYLCLNEG